MKENCFVLTRSVVHCESVTIRYESYMQNYIDIFIKTLK